MCISQISIITKKELDNYTPKEKDEIMKKLWQYILKTEESGTTWTDVSNNVGLTAREINYLISRC